MKYWLAILAVIGFIAVAVFGFAGMSNCHGEGGLGCIASMAEGLFCPAGGDSAVLALFHAGIYHGFSTAVFNGSALALVFLLAVGFAVSIAGAGLFAGGSFFLESQSGRSIGAAGLAYLVRKPQIHWLQLHEKRDPAF